MIHPEKQSRVLVVDDNEMNRDVLSRRLRKQGFEVDQAIDGLNALDMLEQSDFDLVLLDIMMPEVDGYEVLGRIKGSDKLKHIPVVMISAIGDSDSVVRCIELGADDYLPKPFNPVLLHARVNASLDKKKLRDRERLYAASLEREMQIGREIQKGFLPESLPQVDGWEIAATFEPARQVAGDFYDAFLLPNGSFIVIVADVCDKGVGAALYMALFRSLLRATAVDSSSEAANDSILLRAVLSTNDYIATTHGRSNMFSTAFVAAIDPRTNVMTYINAGHEAPVVLSPDGSLQRLDPCGPALGLLPQMPFDVRRHAIASQEHLIIFTDGITEAKGQSGFYGEERLLGFARQNIAASAAVLMSNLVADVQSHAGDFERSDDITLMVLRRAEKS